ncbi:T9SS type A sorting domain-containing protein [Aquimarina sp. ERC-38]|uniref:T9SS type A sorting domain-containing protein n=1 Tax=Aquimarina sp. ERC-38 TaxID=2949996 RepID=UPI0022461FE4|nr:T9SS type A sorting domain-containing protein [Aquimarina sp. ERC-38]UZO80616.1 T9SS type A sorting domain-containing protein [Aquimarina sp. ERC-38]
MNKKLLFKILFIVICYQGSSQTNISGGIFSNTTFDIANSPYIVTDNVVLFPDVQLTIEPGVEIKFNTGKQMEIRGELIAIGNMTSRIVFTSNNTPPSRGDWNGIKIKNSLGAKASFEYCDFSYATSSNNTECCWDGGPIYYKNSRFDNNQSAMTGYTGYDIDIDNCEFTNNIYCITSADKNITNSTFTNNDYGLYSTERVDVSNSTFTNNQNALYGGRGLLENCIITNNVIGVDSFFEGFEIRSCNISNNEIGIKTSNYDGYTAPIKDNQICNNTIFNVENTDNINKDLTKNCWCLEDQNSIEEKLKDAFDNLNLGLISYSIYDTNCEIISSEVIKDRTLSINEDFDIVLNKPSIGPNPFLNNLSINLEQTVAELTINIYSFTGQIVYSLINHNISETEINLQNLNSGIYMMNLTFGNRIINKKLVKK